MATAKAFDKFVKYVYNGFEIIINNEDKYFNASKIVTKYSHKKLNDYMRNKDFVEFSNEIKNVEHAEIPVSYFINNVSNEFKGTYLHPLFLNSVCEWINKKYAIKVAIIMKSINEQNTTEMNKRIKDLQDKNNELKTQIVQDIGDQRENSKYIFIDKVDENTFKIVYDQKKKNKQHYKTFEVLDSFGIRAFGLASANVAKNTELKKYYIDKHKRTFNLSNLDKVIEIISANHLH